MNLPRQQARRVGVVRRAFRHNLIALGGLAISVAGLAVLTYFADFHFLSANLFAVGAATLWNYAASRS